MEILHGSPVARTVAARWFEHVDGRVLVRGVPLEELAERVGSPFFIYDAALLRDQLAALRTVLPSRFDLYYSIKANPHPRLVELLVNAGAGCEISSGGEYIVARNAGTPAERIVFAGPAKGADELALVVEHGIGAVHLENEDEIEMLGTLCAQRGARVRVAIRVNPSSSATAGGALQMAGKPTAFGFDEDELERIVALVRRHAGLELRGLHVFSGTQILDVQILANQWRNTLQLAAKLARMIDSRLDTVDVGGGLGVPTYPREEELDLVALGVIAQELDEKAAHLPGLEHARILVEPGRFLAGPAGAYVARVRTVKRSRGSTFVVLDGGMNHHLAASGNLGQVMRRDFPIVNASRLERPADGTVNVVGPLCTPIDTLGRSVELPPTHTGDLVAILQSGAYALVASPTQFLGHPRPAEVLVDGGRVDVISPRGTWPALEPAPRG